MGKGKEKRAKEIGERRKWRKETGGKAERNWGKEFGEKAKGKKPREIGRSEKGNDEKGQRKGDQR